jgi:transposase
MKGWYMYSRIQQFKDDGLTRLQASKKLNIDYKTVRKYWNMSPDEYANYKIQTKTRRKKLDKYKDDTLGLLFKHNDYKVSQILDRLHEKYPIQQKEIKYSTLRRYVKYLRKEHDIPKKTPRRQYQAIADPPMGYQAQVDLGFKKLRTVDDELIKLCVMTIVLSNSRYKYAKWFDHPPNTTDIINFHDNAFRYYGGKPQEIVYDQDTLIVKDENFGDIIYTLKFETYRQKSKFSTFICRSRDPETKGRIESVVKFVKDNFAHHRIFNNIEEFNELCLAWLDRTGNYKIHGTTKKAPVKMFKKEQKHLKPVPDMRLPKTSKNIISRKVNKDNTIRYNANRYTLPLGTYEPGKEVGINVIEEKEIHLIDYDTGEIIAEHELCFQRGQLIQNTNHLRDHSKKIKELYQNVIDNTGENETIKRFLNEIKKDKPRYIRDQYLLIIETAKNISQEEIFKAINYCVDNELWSATDLVSVVDNLDKLPVSTNDQEVTEIDDIYTVKTVTRDLAEYENILNEVNK